MQGEQRKLLAGVEDVYCRCCFKIFRNINERVPIHGEFLERIRQLLQLEMSVTEKATWICTLCDNLVKRFWNFKVHVVAKQEQFSKMNPMTCKIISEIQKLAPPPELWEESQKMTVQNQTLKEEVIEDDPFELEEVNIKEEPMDIESVYEHPVEPNKSQILLTRKKLPLKIQMMPPRAASAPKRDIIAMAAKLNIQVLPKALLKARKCRDCKKWVKDIPGHMNKDHGRDNDFHCSACGFKAKSRKNVKKHIQNIYLDMRPSYKFKCEICQIIVNDINLHYRQRHKKTVQNYMCGLCGFRAFVKEAIEVHIKKAHLDQKIAQVHKQIVALPQATKRAKKCKDCGKSFKDIIGHRRRKHGHNQVFKCSGCLFSAATRDAILKHINEAHHQPNDKEPTHTICEFCGKAFQSLERHIKNVHQKKSKQLGTFICDRCGKVKTTKSNLIGHLKRNHLPRNIKCTQCDYICSIPEQIKFHVSNVHIEKRFECPLPNCGVRFKKEDSIKDHLRRHKKELIYPCTDAGCSMRFVTKSEVKEHYRNSHGKFFLTFYLTILIENIYSSKGFYLCSMWSVFWLRKST